MDYQRETYLEVARLRRQGSPLRLLGFAVLLACAPLSLIVLAVVSNVLFGGISK